MSRVFISSWVHRLAELGTLATLSGAALASTSCGAGGGDKNSSDFRLLAEGALAGATVHANDMPNDWKRYLHNAAGGDDLNLPDRCRELSEDGFRGAVVSDAESEYQNAKGDVLFPMGSAFRHDADAAESLSHYVSVLEDCRPDLEQALVDQLRTQNVEQATAELRRVDDRGTDADSRHFRIAAHASAGGRSIDVTVDFFVLRRGHLLNGLAYTSQASDSNFIMGLVDKLDKRMRQQDASLPD